MDLKDFRQKIQKAGSRLSPEERAALQRAVRQARRLLANADPADARKAVKQLRAIASSGAAGKALERLANQTLKGAKQGDIQRLIRQAARRPS